MFKRLAYRLGRSEAYNNIDICVRTLLIYLTLDGYQKVWLGDPAILENVVHEWHGAWATWDELHSNAEVRVLLEKSQALIRRMKEGMKGSSKSGPEGHH